MKTLINILRPITERQFNFLDMVVQGAGAIYLSEGKFGSAAIIYVVGMLIIILCEQFVERNNEQSH